MYESCKKNLRPISIFNNYFCDFLRIEFECKVASFKSDMHNCTYTKYVEFNDDDLYNRAEILCYQLISIQTNLQPNSVIQ